MVNKYLITGANSFIGKYLINKLDIHAEEYLGIDIESENPKILSMDIRNNEIEKYVEKDQIVIHLAAVSNDKSFDQDAKHAKEVNTEATLNLISICNEKKIKKFIFASSEWVYGNYNKDIILKENKIISLSDLSSKYALSKFEIENYILNNNFSFNYNLLRFAITYGKRDKKLGLLETLNKHMLNNDSIELNSSLNARKYIHVKDLVNAIYLISKKTSSGIYNICGDELITLRKFVETFELVNGKKIKIVEKDKNNFNIRNLSNNKIKLDLNWAPKINIYDGIKSLQ